MKKIKQFLPFFTLKKVRSIFTIVLLMMFGISLNGQNKDCICPDLTASDQIVSVGDLASSPQPLLSAHPQINLAQPYTGCIIVYGTFTVDVDWDINDADISMATPGAEIIVTDAELTITESVIHGTCEFLWRSITLSDPNSSLVLTDSEINKGC